MTESPKIKLSNGLYMPAFGFGTWNLAEGQEVIDAVTAAVDEGYRLIDTAKIYRNEKGVGEAVRSLSVPRKDLFITTKLWTSDQGYSSALQAFETSMEKLGLDYLDLYLIHWPGHNPEARKQSWQAFEELNKVGKIKTIGISNYHISHLEELLSYAEIMPAVNQIEFNPFIYEEQRPILEFCRSNNIVVEAYSPLAHGRAIDNERIKAIAARYSKTPAQIMLRWAYQHGTVPIPKSAHYQRIKENIQIFDFALNEQDMQELNGLSM